MCVWDPALDLSPFRAGQHIGQCVSSNHLCLPLRREHLPTSVPVFSGLHGWSPADFSLVFLCPFFAPESSSTLVWLFYLHCFCCSKFFTRVGRKPAAEPSSFILAWDRRRFCM